MSSFVPSSLASTPPLLARMQRALSHTRNIANFAAAQAIVQLIGFASGILIVRRLEAQDYAFFTIANTMQGTMSVLADVGIGLSLVSLGGQHWQDRNRFGQLITAAQRLRRQLAILSIALVTPILYWMLRRNGASFAYSTALALPVAAAVLFQLSLDVFAVVPRLRADIAQIRKIDLFGSVARLLMLASLALLVLNAVLALVAGTMALLLQYLLQRGYVARTVNLRAEENAADGAEMRRFIKNQLPNALFYSLQGQITVLLISIFGRQATAVAEVGALGRLVMIFTVLGQLLMNVFVPAFARAQEPRRMRHRYAVTVAGAAGFSVMIIAVAALFPRQLLLILGNKYAHLEPELLLVIAGAVIVTFGGTLWVLNAAKGWIAGSWSYIPLTLATEAALIPFLDFSRVHDVLVFNIVAAIPNVLVNVVLSYRGFRSIRLR